MERAQNNGHEKTEKYTYNYCTNYSDFNILRTDGGEYAHENTEGDTGTKEYLKVKFHVFPLFILLAT